jgi:hypothetical protein
MTDREAMFALALPEPDYADTPTIWQLWIEARRAALEHASAQLRVDQALAPPVTVTRP